MSFWRSLLGKKSADKQQETAKVFRHLPTSPRASDAKQATAIIFDEALKVAKRLPVNEIYRPFNEVVRPWGAKGLYRGPAPAIRGLVLDNLARISHEPEFEIFHVFLREDEATVQISALFPGFFIGVQVWQGQEDCLANGNSDFGPSCALTPTSGIKVETAG
jgi:hypothetical protein